MNANIENDTSDSEFQNIVVPFLNNLIIEGATPFQADMQLQNSINLKDTVFYNLLVSSGLLKYTKGLIPDEFKYFQVKSVGINNKYILENNDDMILADSIYLYLRKIPGDYSALFKCSNNKEYTIQVSTYKTPILKESFIFKTNLSQVYLFTSWEDNEALCQINYILYSIKDSEIITLGEISDKCDI